MKLHHFAKTLLPLAVLATAASGVLSVSHADEEHTGRDTHQDRLMEHGKGGTALGICAGQALAQQGITLPPPVQGGRYPNPSGDQSTEQAIQSAIKTCRTQFATPASPSPSPTGSEAPVPSAAPSPTGS